MSRRRRILVWLLVLFLVWTVAGGIELAEFQIHVPRRTVPPTPQGFSDVTLGLPDGITLRGWLAHPVHPNGGAVILLHGIADNREGMLGYGRLFLDHGYTVLLPDSRAHGASSGDIASFGLAEAPDVSKWTDALIGHEHPRCLFGMGESMGAGILLQSLVYEKRFCAVIAESPFADGRSAIYDRTARLFNAGPWLGKTLFRGPIEFGWLYARWRYDLEFYTISPRDAVAQSRTPLLLIHGDADTNLRPYNSRAILAARPAATELWEVPGAVHCGARTTSPAEFDRRVLAFFDANLLRR